MDVSEESYLLALVSALNLTHLVGANSTSSDLAVILEEVLAKKKVFFLQKYFFSPELRVSSRHALHLGQHCLPPLLRHTDGEIMLER